MIFGRTSFTEIAHHIRIVREQNLFPSPAGTGQCGLDPIWESKLDFDSYSGILLSEDNIRGDGKWDMMG